jgi:hypothetical protein
MRMRNKQMHFPAAFCWKASHDQTLDFEHDIRRSSLQAVAGSLADGRALYRMQHC